MVRLGYHLVKSGMVVQSWGGTPDPVPFPSSFNVVLENGEEATVFGAKLGEDYHGYVLSEWWGEVVEPVPQTITRRQCALQLLEDGLINGPEAVEMVQIGKPPQYIVDYFETLPENVKYIAYVNFAADSYSRTNEILMTVGAARQIDLDEFFRKAAKK